MFWFRLLFVPLVAIKNASGSNWYRATSRATKWATKVATNRATKVATNRATKALYWAVKRGIREPEAALGFFHLNESYQEAVVPKKAAAICQMEPVFVVAIDSFTRKMGIEIKLKFVWEDPGITWKRGDLMTAGSSYSFDHSVLK